MSIYNEIVKNNINKVLSLYNTDKFSKTYGYGDREYWGWKTKDFVNASLQGGIHTLAISLKLNIFSLDEKKDVLEIINSAILAIEDIKEKNGSLSEAYPQENSFCVTALVAFDILSAINHLTDYINEEQKNRYFAILKPLIEFISNNDEEHAIISNHIATGVAAISLWNHLNNDNNPRNRELLQIIYDNQSEEGWYKEYEGADPGYQTLCTYYLFCTYKITNDEKLLLSLRKSANFLKYFIHPDGTIGGLYGSRNTEVFYPAGIIGLSKEIEEFALVSKYLKENGQHVLPQDIDIGNYIPLLNSYAVAALYYDEVKKDIHECEISPFYKESNSINFKETGIHLYSNKKYFSIINYKKGGTIKVFDQKTKKIDIEDGGLFGISSNKEKFSTQQFDDTITFANYAINANLYKINESSPTPFNFIILRILSLTIFKSIFLGNIFKKFIVNMLMTGKNKINGSVLREFNFQDEKIIINEKIHINNMSHIGKSKAIHMASSGYFIKQNFYNDSKIVEFINV